MNGHIEQIVEALREAEQLQSELASALAAGNNHEPHIKRGQLIAEARQILECIETLREDERDSVEILSDNPDFNGQKNCAVLTGNPDGKWWPQRHEGDTLLEALQAACKAKEAAK